MFIKKIAVVGAFDVKSYGDCLFPIILQQQLNIRHKKSWCRIKLFLFSPLGNEKNEYANLPVVYSVDRLEELHLQEKFSAIIIGGGDVLNYDYSSVNIDGYDDERYPAGGGLWVIPSIIGYRYSIPVLWNAIGVPKPFAKADRWKIKSFTEKAAYKSVRDEYSMICLEQCDTLGDIHLIPDSAYLLNTIWPKSTHDITPISQQYPSFPWQNYYVFQCTSSPYIDVEETVEALERIIDNQKVGIVLLTVNACHQDTILLSAINDRLKNNVLQLNDGLTVNHIAALLAHSDMVIASSLHAAITAVAYNVPFIALDIFHDVPYKTNGNCLLGGFDKYCIAKMCFLPEVVNALLNDRQYTDRMAEALQKYHLQLKNHFDRLYHLAVDSQAKNVADEIYKSNLLGLLSLKFHTDKRVAYKIKLYLDIGEGFTEKSYLLATTKWDNMQPFYDFYLDTVDCPIDAIRLDIAEESNMICKIYGVYPEIGLQPCPVNAEWVNEDGWAYFSSKDPVYLFSNAVGVADYRKIGTLRIYADIKNKISEVNR